MGGGRAGTRATGCSGGADGHEHGHRCLHCDVALEPVVTECDGVASLSDAALLGGFRSREAGGGAQLVIDRCNNW